MHLILRKLKAIKQPNILIFNNCKNNSNNEDILFLRVIIMPKAYLVWCSETAGTL